MSPPLLPQDIIMTETDVERDMTGETVCGFRVAAWRETHPEHGDKFGHRYSEHWSTPSQNPAVKIERLFTETQLLAALSRAPDAGRDELRRCIGRARRILDANELHETTRVVDARDELVEAEKLLAALSPPSTGGALTGDGFVYHNPDVGAEYAPSHPVESGEVPDATDMRASTQFEDWLVREAAVNLPTSTGGEGEAVAWRMRTVADTWMAVTDKAYAETIIAQGGVVEPLYLHPSPEMGEISREELAELYWEWNCSRLGGPWYPGAKPSDSGAMERSFAFADAILSKLKENGLSREELGGLARSQPGSDAQERSPVLPSQGGEGDA